MKILVMSDSHSSLRNMRRYISFVKPSHIIHLGDLMEDAQAISEQCPQLRFHMVPGNCDIGFLWSQEPKVLCYDVGGVRLFMTHGHLHGVKSDLTRLIDDARQHGAAAALFGHTHRKHCHQEEDGMWVINPGSCRGDDGSVAVLEVEDGKISACTFLEQADIMPQ